MVDRGGKYQNLLELSNENLMNITQDAHHLLKRYDFLNPNKVNIVKKQFKSFFNFHFMKGRVVIVLGNDLIEDLIRGVDMPNPLLTWLYLLRY
jgi:hypothetical protein